MSRPKCCRHISGMPDKNYFKPKGIPSAFLEEVVLTLDEFEALRLADLEGLYQEQAAARMNISRPTFGRIIETAHQKIADVLVNGKALKIEGGEIAVKDMKQFRCRTCCRTFNAAGEAGRKICPYCRRRA